ncbi:MAG: cation:proton antiporter [Desulfobulbaceae bacterium]|jgi:Kef-type K+ transport system membrane component KefB|nr:cation:proton antiporter [Desulfobulbaceae bacterium]
MLAYLHLSSITGLGLLLFCGYFCGQLVRYLKLPALIGYLAAGVLLGPSVLNVLTETQLQHLGFITSLALGCIAFIIGSELHLTSLKKMGGGIIVIILAESFMAFLVVTGGVFLLTHNLPLSLLLGAMAPASAPAGTVAVIQEYKARGTLTKTLYAVVGFDDGLAVIIFGFALAAAKLLLITDQLSEPVSFITALEKPMLEIGFSLILGGCIGGAFSWINKKTANESDHLIIIFWAILTCVGLATRWHLSSILSCMMVGFVFVNVSKPYLVKDTRAPLQHIMDLIFILFFGLAGLHLDLTTLPTLGTIGLVYIITRIAGLISGAWFGARCGRMEEKIRHYLGFGILSQAGVAIGLALLVQQELAQIPGAELLGVQILSTITATSIIFEFIGPLAAKYALKKAGEITEEPS